jgi:serine protease Do
MITRYALISALLVGILCAAPAGVQAQKEETKDFDRVTPLVRAVQKCQGAVVAFMNPKTAKPMGTGVIVDDRGIIVTNVHVVGTEKKVPIQLLDKTEVTGEVLGTKGDYDLAVVKITTSKKLDALPPCKSDKVYPGEEVIVIGHPYGYSYSITRGILSATGRKLTLPSGVDITDVYQTDAPINPGNSGGPLMNINGELIAINFAMRQGAQDISFAIPAKKVREVLADYLK